MKRRDFLKYTGLSTVAGLFGAILGKAIPPPLNRNFVHVPPRDAKIQYTSHLNEWMDRRLARQSLALKEFVDANPNTG